MNAADAARPAGSTVPFGAALAPGFDTRSTQKGTVSGALLCFRFPRLQTRCNGPQSWWALVDSNH